MVYIGKAMFECKICGLLSLSSTACPACGSQLLVDLALEDGDSSQLPNEVPGLDDAVASWYELEGTEPPEEAVDQPTQVATTGSLPFGFSGESNTHISRLPFGVGSYATGMPFVSAEEPLPLVSDLPSEVTSHAPQPVPHSPTTPSQGTEPESAAEVSTTVPQAPSLPEPPLSDAEERVSPMVSHGENVAPPVQHAPSQELPVEVPEMPLLSAVRVESVPAPARVRVEAEAIPVQSFEQETLPITHEALPEDVPDMWRIDASPINMQELYAVEQEVVEVVHSMDETAEPYLHTTEIEDLHPESGIISLDLHPARAMAVNLSGIPELESTLAEGFEAIGNESWAQAAIAFQKMAAKMPGDSAVFNNYGLALLQRALVMAKSSDLNLQQLASTQFESAILALREAAKSSPSDGTILLNLAHALLVSGRPEKAMNLLFMYQKHNENGPESANLEAATLVSMGESGRALEVLQAVQHDSTVTSNIMKLTYS